MTYSKLLRRLLAICLSFGVLTIAQASTGKTYFSDREDVRLFVSEMVKQHGFDEVALLDLFAATASLPNVIKLIQPPADPQTVSWVAYRKRFIEPRRIAAGKRFMAQHADVLVRAESTFGVPREIIGAIIGVETIYGRDTGRVNTLAALATLAFDYPPRAELFRRELGELLLLAREANRDPTSYQGSYAGALGLPQFLPSSIRKFAIDFDGDGNVDLATNPTDAIGSVARFLKQHEWRTGEPIAILVNAEGDGLAESLRKGVLPTALPSDFEKIGLSISPVGAGDTPLANLPAAVLDFTSPNAPTEYRLGYQNFYVITRYNRSRFYAATVMDFAAVLATQ
jgi:membrane-bound lytic murein transglycosylase B